MRALKDQVALPSGGYGGKKRSLPNARPQKDLVQCAQ